MWGPEVVETEPRPPAHRAWLSYRPGPEVWNRPEGTSYAHLPWNERQTDREEEKGKFSASHSPKMSDRITANKRTWTWLPVA